MPNNKRENLIEALQELSHNVMEIFYETTSDLDNPNDLELHDELNFEGFESWFGDDELEEKLNPDFAVFGQRGCGSMVALWLLEDRDLKDAPVVLISSEGELGVIGRDYLSFMAVMGLGYDVFQLMEEDMESPWHDRSDAFCEEITSKFGAETPENLKIWRDEARAKNPDLNKYVESMKA